jgi:hypothetical protein
MVIWLDAHIGLDEYCRDLKREFAELTSNFKFESTIEGCRKLLPKVKDRKIFFIIQGKLSKDIVPDIEQIIPKEMEPVVYIFCIYEEYYREQAKKYESTKRGDVFVHEKDLFDQLEKDLNKYALDVIQRYLRSIISEKPVTDFMENIVGMSRRCYQNNKSAEIFHDPSIAVK